MVDIGSGEEVVVRTANPAQAERGKHSRKSVRLATKKTARLTPDQALEILQQSLFEFERAGGDVLAIGNMPDRDAGNVFIVAINDVLYCQHCHHLSLGSICQHCAGNEVTDAG